MIPELIAFGAVLAVLIAVVIGSTAAQKAHEDKLDRRAMYSGVMQAQRAHDEAELAICGNDREKLNAWYLDADGKRAERNAQILARAKEVWGIS